MDTYEVTVEYNGNIYCVKFDEPSYLKFQRDPSYVKQFLPTDTKLVDEEITSKLTGLIDSETGNHIDLSHIDSDTDEGCTGANFPLSSEDATLLNDTSPNASFDCAGPSNVHRKDQRITSLASQSTVGHTTNVATLHSASGDPNSAKKKTLRKTKVRLNTILEGEFLDDAEAHLLQLVFDRPMLFDYTLPITERNPTTMINTWAEVHKKMKEYIKQVMGEKANNLEITIDTIRETWLNIRTQYMRYRSNTKKKTGMSPSKTLPIKHLNLLRNYETVAMKRQTLSNMENVDDDDDAADRSEQYDDEYAERRVSEAKPPKKRGRVNDEFISAAQKALTSFNKRLERLPAKPVSNPTFKITPDSSSSHFAESIVTDLNLLNAFHLTRAKMRISQVIYEELSQQNEQQ